MKDMITYSNYNRDQLIELVNLKNKKIDSQRAMLYQSRVKRKKLQSNVKKGYKVVKQNISLRAGIEKLSERIKQLISSGILKKWVVNEHAAGIINAIMTYSKLKKDGVVTDNEIFLLFLGYQKEWFFSSDIETFNNIWGRNKPRYLKRDFRVFCEAGYFYSDKVGRKKYYYMSYVGRCRLKSLLERLYMGK